MPKIRIIDLFIFAFLFTAAVSFPFSQLNAPIWVQYTLRICIQGVLLLSYYLCIKKYKIPLWGNANKKNLLLMLPLVIVIACTMFSLPFADQIFVNESSLTTGIFFFELALAILQPINEEIMFRLFIHSQLPIKNRLLKILASAGIFGAIHLLNFFFNGFNPQYLIQVAYTFGLGLILGFIYEYGESIISCMVFHVLYNFINTTVYSYLLTVLYSGNANLKFYLPCGIVAIVAFVYMALLYVFYLRKQTKDNYVW